MGRSDFSYRLGKIRWAVKQLVPCTYWTIYGIGVDTDGTVRNESRFVIWKMWLGRCYQTIEFTISGEVSASNHFANVWPGDPRSAAPWPKP